MGNIDEDESNLYPTALHAVEDYSDLTSSPPDEVHFIGMDFKEIDNPHFNHPDLYPFHSVSKPNRLLTPQLNNVTYKSTSSPLLTQFEDISPDDICDPYVQNITSDEFRACTHAVSVGTNKLVELVIYDEGRPFSAGHPMHLHGQHFAVVAMKKVNDTLSKARMEELYESGGIEYKLDRPVIKDSVIIHDGGYTVIRFRSSNPGWWSFHCHLEFHLEAGMGMLIRVGNQTDIAQVPDNIPRCGHWTSNKVSDQSEDTPLTTTPKGSSDSVFRLKTALISLVLESIIVSALFST